MIKRGDKRGSHIDVILSFVIFSGFIVFLYIIIQPNAAVNESKVNLVSYLGAQLIENLSGGEITRISTSISYEGGPASCVVLDSFASAAEIESMRVITTNLTGKLFPSYKSASGSDLEIDMSPYPASNYFYIYYSPELSLADTSSLGGCKHLTHGGVNNIYEIEQKEDYSQYYIFAGSVEELITLYDSDYDSVKQTFGLTGIDNFRFDFTYQDGTTIGTVDNIPLSVNVYSELFPVVYLSREMKLESGYIVVRVW